MVDPRLASRLYNCCTDFIEPDWRMYQALELGGCRDAGNGGPGDDTDIHGGFNRHEAQFFTVYGQLHTGEFDALTDCDTFDAAVETLGQLGIISGLPTTITC